MTTEHMTPAQARKAMAKAQAPQGETAIKKQVKQYLLMRSWFVFYNLQGVGAYKGVPDFIVVKDGRVVFVELKTAKGKMSEHQLRFQADCAAHGAEYRVVRCLEDAMDMDRQREGMG